jgi:uncharacterized protein involved in exopolysaccharide biosynthesis
MAQEHDTIKDYINAFRRRSSLFLSIFVAVLAIAIAFAVIPANVYRASAEMRIDLAGPNIDVLEPVILTSYADQYVQTLEQKVMTTDNLRAWLNESGAYEYSGPDVSESELISKLQESIRITMVFTSVIDEQTGKEVDLITGFTIAFVGREPVPAKIIANSVARAFLAEDRATRVAEASTAASFLLEQIDAKREEIAAIEARIATFKEQNAGKLPELMVLNMTALERAERELESVQREIRNLEQDRFYREAQLEELRQSAGGEAAQLAELEAEYYRIIALYGSDHPDVIRIQRQIAALTNSSSVDVSPELARLEAELAAARERYSDQHPDVLSLEQRVEELRASGRFTGDANIGNPLYLQLRAQINAISTNLAGLRTRAAELRRDQAELQDKIASTPQVERRYQELQRDLQTATLAFDGLRDRLVQAQQIESFESGERGARLLLVRSADVPSRPSGPPRLAITIVGLFLAATFAGGAAFIAEISDNTIRGSKDILAVLHSPPIAVVPIAKNSVSIARRRNRAIILTISVLIIVSAFVVTSLKFGA